MTAIMLPIWLFGLFFTIFEANNSLMKKWIIFPIIIFLAGCKGNQDNSFFTNEKAAAYFGKIENACNSDSGKLWGTNLYGPLMFVDRNSRRIIANEPDNEGLLKEKDGVYTGTYPKELLIYTSAADYGGKFFSMTLMPAEEDEYKIVSRAIHSLFHRYENLNGFSPSVFDTRNMDEKNARLWIKLEWKALRKAISSEGQEQQLAIRDALIFRGSNHELYQKFAADEIRFESYEGLATFTYILLSTNSHQEFLERLFQYLDRIYSSQSYTRTYGQIHGALYATLLFEKGFDFSSSKPLDTDLGALVKDVYMIDLPEVCRDIAGSLSVNYDIETIYKEEKQRDMDIEERFNKFISTYTEKPVVLLELESPSFDFEPEDIHPLDTLGTLYSAMRISDNWGKLVVENGGCLVANNLKSLRVTAKSVKQDKNKISGEGWHLILNDNWDMTAVGENYFVHRLMP